MRFPLFIDITGKKAVVIGGGTIALRRATVLRDFGAAVTVIAPETTWPGALRRPYMPGDLADAFVVVAATNDRTVNHAVWQEAKSLGILVNVCDCQTECDFFFPAICRTGSLVAGLVGDGSDHHKVAAAAKRIRQQLEELE